MRHIVSAFDIPILMLLLFAHLAGDFIFQPLAWVDERYEKHWKSKWLCMHVLVHIALSLTALFILMPASWSLLGFALIIGATHWLIDVLKSYSDKNKIIWFVLDQTFHLLVIFLVWIAISNQWSILASLIPTLLSEKIMFILIAYFIVIWPFSIAISIICKSWSDQMDTMGALPNAGKRIGQIERFLILTFILANEFAAIGFLLAAKSILRFGDSKEPNHRKINEYVLVGTMISFSMTIAFGMLVKMLVSSHP